MPSAWLLIKNGTVIDGTGAPPFEGTHVLVKDNRIVDVGPHVSRDSVPRGEPLEEIDATGKTVMPGLIDAHCHMTYGESRTEEEIDLYTSPELRTLKAAWNAQKVLRAGVTGISQPGGSYYIGVGLREAIRDGIVLGPRMTSAGRYISTSNSLTDWYPDSVGVPEGSIGILANTLDGMIDELRHQVKNGVDLIKLADSPYGNYQAFTNDELKALADLAHQLGKRVTIHARGSAEVDAAVQAGIDWIMHGNVMSDETIEHLAESRIPLVPTLLLLANIVDWGEKVGAPKPMREGMARMLDRTADSLHRAHEAGVRFALGTDSGFSVTPYGEWHARELELLMTYAGLSPLEAIQAGTQNGAVMLNLEGEVGVIAPGMLADIIVVNGDPVKDIRVLQDKRRIETVIKDGRRVVFDEEAVSRRWPHERAQIYSVTDLTYDLVYGESDGVDGHVEPPLNGSDAKDLVADVKRREKSAGLSS
ncbi:amidohydrolase [Carbonactinospora thermoautotrophica]|uniref:Amidohydrolase n=1 Tax=Carbonactinospora thermoautotrophica TaxID=1469144 RepID=A0A132N1Z8_9ACTN|nr:amidohydrolase family protein [Carbonactinospora thermoautotrophica]KWW97683.1 amidohydrolase [Carbonactinospora thermoautotrophica]KWX00922.1 Amidohydrolase [Carbonactinospora thermoautotrophica]KWX03950.1 amidohydrolase [Carbonactinospora thermoautotrophica]